VLAAVFFILLTSQLNLKGTTAELEMFANLPVVAAVYLTLHYDKQKDHLIWFFWSGVLFGIVLAFKVSLFLFVIVVGVWLLFLFYQESRATNQWRQQLVALVRRCLVLLLGMVVITSLILALLAWQGVLHRFLLVFKMGETYLSYSSTLPVYRVILIPLIILAYNNAALLVFSLVGVLRLGYAIRRGNVPSVPFYVALATWLLVSFVITGITRIGYVHYALIAVPPIVLISALEIHRVSVLLIERFKLKGRSQIIPQASILVLVIASSLVFNYSSPYHYLRYRLGLESFEDYLTEGTIEGTSLVNSLKVAKYIAQNTLSTDYIYNWSESPQIYYYSDRRSPIETIWPYYATAFGSYKRIFVPETKYIILGHSIYAEVPDWMRAELAQNFYLETVIGDYQLYRRNAP
jgi:4-amino-4-deoxy-L-arabinose transferase-like glycosyltransferase